MTRSSVSHKVGPPCKASPLCKVGPAHAAKTNHKFGTSKLPDTECIAEGSLEDGSPELSPTNKDSGIVTHDTTVIDSTTDGPAITHSECCLLTNDEDVVPDGPEVQSGPPKHKLHQHRQTSSAAHQGEDYSDESSPEGSNYNDAKQSESSSNNDNANKSPLPSYTQPPQVDKDHISPPPPARRAHDKGRKLPPPTDDEDLDDSQHQVDLDKNPGDPFKSGQLPQEAIDKAITLGDKTVAEAAKIAKEYGKSTCTILIQAGLAVKAT
ncbi:hypothetical protein BDR04DRAFT_1165054 [Suillus decipiens]|nr:hypothetical protein BDR04DRAFT_1165054 [Suillus decipiens]